MPHHAVEENQRIQRRKGVAFGCHNQKLCKERRISKVFVRLVITDAAPKKHKKDPTCPNLIGTPNAAIWRALPNWIARLRTGASTCAPCGFIGRAGCGRKWPRGASVR